MSIKSFTEKIKKNVIWSVPDQLFPQVDPDSDPHQNKVDPKQCLQ